MDTFTTLAITVLLLFGIVWACTLFTNAIEWLGHRFKLSEGAVGSVLAAVGTALPETLVPLIAILGGVIASIKHPEQSQALTDNAQHIGIGAILGAPFLLSTLALGLVGVAVFFYAAKRKRGLVLHIDLHLFKRDLNYFFAAYGLVIAASMISVSWVKYLIAAALLGFYGVYVKRTLAIEHIPDEEFDLEPLTFASKTKEPATSIIIAQVSAGLAGIILMAHLFVEQIHHLSTIFHISPLVLSLIIAPIATELPEKCNSWLWIGSKKDNLALGNITGAMVFQSCIPTAIGIALTPWVLDFQGMLSVILCFASAGLIYAGIAFQRILTPQALLSGIVFYALFLGYSIYVISSGHVSWQ